jgi:hypothetical protein
MADGGTDVENEGSDLDNPYIQEFKVDASGTTAAFKAMGADVRLLKIQQEILRTLRPVPEVETEQAKHLVYVEEAAIDLVLRLFPLLNREDLKKSSKVKMPNFGLREDMYLEPYQIAFVAISILHEQGQVITGRIIGDDPGAGKTIQLIAQALTNFYHAINVKEVLEDRAKGDNRRHLADGHEDREKYPSAAIQPVRG